MDEKKLTDEQKSMYELNVYRNRYYAEPQGTEKAIIANAINDLFNVINCLHERNAGLNDKNATLEYKNSELKQRVSILEADNDDYKDKIAENELVSIDWHNEQVGHLEEEIERLTKRLELADKDNDNLAKTIFDYEKQVDELKDERENMQAEILSFEDMKFTQEHCYLYSENETLKQWLKRLNADLENEKNWGKIQTKQAVEERTKEIFDELLKDENVHINVRLDQWGETYNVACVDFDTIEELAKERYGVEVDE